MNNFRAGLYSSAPTTTWLHGIGIASPPTLVMLGLTLPDSRILNGIAGIGLTIANIAFILPHLRQSVLDSIRTHETALANQQSARGQISLSGGFNATQPVSLNMKSPSLASVSSRDQELQNSPLTQSATVKSVRSTATEPLAHVDVDAEVAPHTIQLLAPEKIDGGQIPLQVCRSPDTGSSEMHASLGHLLAREGRGPLYIPLPVPDEKEIAFFDIVDASLSSHDIAGECSVIVCAEHSIPAKPLTIEVNGRVVRKGTEQGSRLVTANFPGTPACIKGDENMVVPACVDENAEPPPIKGTVRDRPRPIATGIVSHLSDDPAAREGNPRSTQVGCLLAGENEVSIKRRPESLEFIPQSVIRRYPSVPTIFSRHCSGHRAHQVTLIPPHILVHNPAILLEGTRPRASYTTMEALWRAPFLTETPLKTRSMGEQTFPEMASAQDLFHQRPALLPEPTIAHELTPPRQYATHRRRFGVLGRAAPRNRRSTAPRYRNDVIYGSSISDSDSESDSDSQYSSGSSADESMLPHILGTDLIAAIDANSESGLNLTGSRKTTHVPPDICEDHPVSEDSAADISMMMHVSSNDDHSDSEVRVPATFRPLSYEDIQLWASGVVRNCVRQACRSRVPVEPPSPSQASDICAERPSGSGTSQCPLSGLHCRLGTAAVAEVPASSVKEPPVSLRSTSILPNQKPLLARNLRDIPEFVPRQRHVPVTMRRVDYPRGRGARSTIDVTRDAATEVIARMENRAGFNAVQRIVGTGDRWMASMAGGWRSMPQRCP